MKTILWAALLALSFGVAHAQTVECAGAVSEPGGSGGTAAVALTCPAVGDSIIAVLFKYNASGASMTDSSGQAFGTPDMAETSISINAGTYYLSVQRIASVTTAGSQTITATWSSTNANKMIVLDVRGIASGIDAISAIAQATSVNASTANICSSGCSNGDFVLGVVYSTTNSLTFSSWLSGMTAISSGSSNSTNGSGATASIVQTTSGAINAGATLSASDPWAAYVIAYKSSTASAPKTGMFFGNLLRPRQDFPRKARPGHAATLFAEARRRKESLGAQEARYLPSRYRSASARTPWPRRPGSTPSLRPAS